MLKNTLAWRHTLVHLLCLVLLPVAAIDGAIAPDSAAVACLVLLALLPVTFVLECKLNLESPRA